MLSFLRKTIFLMPFILFLTIAIACSAEPGKNSTSSSESATSSVQSSGQTSSAVQVDYQITQFGVFSDGQLSVTNQTNWHAFPATNGFTYSIEYMDAYDLAVNNPYHARIYAVLYRSDKTAEIANINLMHGYTYACSNTESAYVMVCAESWWGCIGSYGIKVTQQ